MKPVPSGEALNSLRHIYDINPEEVDEILQIYESTQNDDLRQIILRLLNRNTQYMLENKRFKRLYKNLVHSEDKLLAAIAFRGLISAELTRDENNKDQWQNWQWSPYIKNLLEKAVETDMHLLSSLYRLELLELSKRYPNSKFTEGCKEYTKLTDGDTYFGNNLKSNYFRQPFNSVRELKVWHPFIKDYPNHPGTNDALYRIARAYELQKDYEKAILYYQKAVQEGDYDYYREIATIRILFLIDSVMSSESVANFISNNPDNFLTPILDYSKAVHLIREDKLLDAKTELEKFVNSYKKTEIENIVNFSSYKYNFWNRLQKQIEQIEQLEKIRNSKKPADEKLYNEASFLFYNFSLPYNLFWHGIGNFGTFWGFTPSKWQGVNTYLQYTVDIEFMEEARKSYDNNNTLLKSLELFNKLVQDYPQSKLKEKAAYSIGLSYYYLFREGWKTPLRQKNSWNDLAIKAFYDFANLFPQSSMADDALLSIAELENENLQKRFYSTYPGKQKFALLERYYKRKEQALEKLIKDYPRGDRRQEAEKMLAESRSSYFVGVGVHLENIDKGVLITGILTDSPASKARLQSGDIILQVDDKEVSNVGDVVDIITRHQPEETVEFQIERGGKKQTVKAVTELMLR